jgi:hypothetical protein
MGTVAMQPKMAECPRLSPGFPPYACWMRHAARLGDEDAIEEMRSNADTELVIV